MKKTIQIEELAYSKIKAEIAKTGKGTVGQIATVIINEYYDGEQEEPKKKGTKK